jgi:hypothetical protein
MRNALRDGLPPLPDRIKALPIDERGYPVPYFVAWIDGKPEFRVADPEKLVKCVKKKRCWVCGQPLEALLAFPIGPMCGINRVTSEPPAHRECAEFSVQACPFLTLPKAQRREANLPDDIKEAPGLANPRNPGVTLLWITDAYQRFDAPGGKLFEIGKPYEVQWYTQGRIATYQEAFDALHSGVNELLKLAQRDGPRACFALGTMFAVAATLLPKREAA